MAGVHILSDDGGAGAGVNAGPNVTDGRWHHLLMTWGDTQWFRSYVDGQLVEQRDAADSEISFLDAPVYFGAFNGVGEFMEGQLDEIAIWERSLTHEEIGNAWNQLLMALKRDFWDCGNLTMEPLKIRHPMDLMESSMEVL